jgi:hypothetical protein
MYEGREYKGNLGTIYSVLLRFYKFRGCSSRVEHLPGMCKALDSILSSTKNNKN